MIGIQTLKPPRATPRAAARGDRLAAATYIATLTAELAKLARRQDLNTLH